MRKAILILAMVFACTLIHAQETYSFKSTHAIAYNTLSFEDGVRTEYIVNFLIKDGYHITNGAQTVTMSSTFKAIEIAGLKMYEAYGIDWEDQIVYILLCPIDGQPDEFGFFWGESYTVFYGELTLTNGRNATYTPAANVLPGNNQ